MEKVIAALWAPTDAPREVYADLLLTSLPRALIAADARHVRINVRDEAVRAGAALVQSWQAPQQTAIAQFWLPSANPRFRAAIDAALADHCDRFALWLVTESAIIANTAHAPQSDQRTLGQQTMGQRTWGQRTWGWSQASFISFRPDLTRAAALDQWHGHHTRVAIETQANFEYIQNLIVRPLTPDAPPYDAFVEECFAIEALTEPAAFFDAVGDPVRFEANLATMMASCQGFIDFTRIDIMPTSQHDFALRD